MSVVVKEIPAAAFSFSGAGGQAVSSIPSSIKPGECCLGYLFCCWKGRACANRALYTKLSKPPSIASSFNPGLARRL